jgi:Cof subfamily protein (haloacid dehalogenase superfamily)
MKKYKMIAFDIDGTILNSENSISKELKETVNHLIDNNYIVTLATARLPISAIEIAKELNLKSELGIITLNGSFITNLNKDIIYNQKFIWNSPYDIEKMHDQVVINYYNGFNWLISKNSSYVQLENNFIQNLAMPEIGNISQVNKITIMGDNFQLSMIKELFTSFEECNKYLLSFSHPNYLEITTNDINKFSALNYYANILGIKDEEIIAFGDGENDIPMLKNVGMGIAMGNANELVKNSAYAVADTNINDGVAKYLQNLLIKNII